ncbi:ATP-dependent nuclease [Lentibacillus sediminis]|uniref:ATP-dependent nuclease n=1 Tax=Lentibacillus sediminis TaxID=1940529 RepID=UPI000C1C14E3|nr:AAA family ATPase [Lentibacillus sediminis]
MKITSIKIKNFRSFGSKEKVIDLSDLSTFIGANSSGKTAALQALQKIFGVTQSERRLVKEDFFINDNTDIHQVKELNLHIEVKIEFPELEESDKNEGKNSVPPFFTRFTIDSTSKKPYIRMRLVGNWYSDNTPDGDIDQKLYFVNIPEGEEENDESLSPVLPHQRSKIQMIYVPAIRQPLKQLKNASGTIFSRILNNVSWPEDMDQQIKNEMAPVDHLFNNIEGVGQIKDIIGEQWRKYHSDLRYNEAELAFSSTTLISMLNKIEIQFSSFLEVKTYTVDKLGDGLQSLFYLSLVSSLLETEEKLSETDIALTVLAVEEPENHISPHLLGKVVENLHNISNRNNAQVLLTSHSESIVKNISPENICHLRIDVLSGTTVANKIKLPDKSSEAYTYVKEAVRAYPEIYFAKLVILGEGDTEEIIIPKFLEIKEISSFESGISVVPLGGRHVNHMWKLLNQLHIPHITLLDLDVERGGGGWHRIKYVLNQLIENGYDKYKLLKVKNGTLTDDELNEMGDRVTTNEVLFSWINRLEDYGVFFSSPLDIDFLMLEHFPDSYKKIMKYGPRLPKKCDDPDEYSKKIMASIRSTLKNENATGKSYTGVQHELMVWYNSLFLGRGKPSTHIEMLTATSDDILLKNCPKVFERMVNHIKGIVR